MNPNPTEMKKTNTAQLTFSILLIAIIFFCSSFIKNQKFFNTNVKEYTKNSLPVVAIALDRMNVFYIGVDNPITGAMACSSDKWSGADRF